MNTFGRNFRVQVFGESHGEAIGVVVDGVKSGIPLSKEDFTEDILRRKSGAKGTTPRIESDEPEILSGVFEGHTTGAPLAIIFRNNNTRSGDYDALRDVPRPGHADFTAAVKWNGFNDPRGGGHFSGRLTLPLVAAGVIAKKQCALSSSSEIGFKAELKEIGGETDPSKWDALLEETSREGDSLGGIVECRIDNVPAGLGNPFFDSVEALLSHAVFSIPGVRGIEFGDGFSAARMKGSEHNDPLMLHSEGARPAIEDNATLGTRGGTGAERSEASGGAEQSEASERPGLAPSGVQSAKNGAGGINGGITNGAPIVFRVAFKPTSSISKTQKTLNIKTGETVSLNVPGRHDVCFALRTPVIVEAVAAIVLADLANSI
ncbi:MAG: chorismate synthase [Bacteroidales bacterium]|nr:chorismate synthase [Bacteroidales bacterium]